MKGRRTARLRERLRGLPRLGEFHGDQVAELPELARRYLTHAIAPGTPLARCVTLETAFEMRLTQGARRARRVAGRELLAAPIGFVWSARTRIGPLALGVEDHYGEDAGGVSVSLLGLPLLRAGGARVTRSARGRLAGEAIWLPSVLLPAFGTSWSALDDERAQATLTIDGEPFALELGIGERGELRELKMLRYGNIGVPWRDIPYGVASEGERTFGGYTIPDRLRGGWWYASERFDREKSSLFEIVSADFGPGEKSER